MTVKVGKQLVPIYGYPDRSEPVDGKNILKPFPTKRLHGNVPN